MTGQPQILGVVPRLWPELQSGDKRSTIRWSEPDVTLGRLRFVCDGSPLLTFDVRVWRVTKLALSDAAGFLGKAKEWPPEVMLNGMQEHYPEVQLQDVVQVIEFLPVSSEN